MECRTIQDNFSAYMDGELPRAQMELVARHLVVCETCRREYQLWRRLWEGLAASPEKAPADLTARVLARLPQRSQPRWRTLALAASVLLGIFLGGRLGLEMHQSLHVGQEETVQLAWEGFEATPANSLDALLASYELENGGGS